MTEQVSRRLQYRDPGTTRVSKLRFWEQNLKEMIFMIKTVPEENVYLNSFNNDYKWVRKERTPTCQSVCCLGGWSAWWPPFRDLGIVANQIGAPWLEGLFQNTAYYNLAEYLTGYAEMFAGKGSGDTSHKQEALDRLRTQLRQVQRQLAWHPVVREKGEQDA